MKAMSRVNMRELAKALGVDRSTVSRALSVDKSHLVGPETRDRIRKAAEDVGYRPDPMAASLRRGRSNTMGILVSDLDNETFIRVVRNLATEFGPGTTIPLIGETRDSQSTTRDLIEQFIARRVDAIISLASMQTDTEVLVRAAQQVPVVLAIRKVTGVELPMSICDDEAGGALVAEHFFARGHRHVCQIKGPTVSATFVDRAQGFSATARGLGLVEPHSEIVAENATVAAGRKVAERVLSMKPRPTAVFAHNDALAIAMMETLRAAGLRCPEDIAIAGYNNTHLSRVLATPLTTIDYPVAEVSRHAGETARQLITDRNHAWTSRLFAPKLIVRDST